MIETNGRLVRMIPATALALVALGLLPVVHAQADKVNTVISEQARAEQAAQQSQQRIAQLDDEATKLLSEYRQSIAEAQSLKVYSEQLALQVKSQQDEIGSMASQLESIETTSREVLPLMTRMLDTLDKFVQLDIPFLPEERARRVTELKEMMTRADVSLSEKYRRIVEAYQIEIEYGRTLETYEGTIGDRTVQFLRAGRVALMYRTLDNEEIGYWDAGAKQWVVDNSYADAIEAGIKVASKQSAPDFVRVPVPAPTESN